MNVTWKENKPAKMCQNMPKHMPCPALPFPSSKRPNVQQEGQGHDAAADVDHRLSP